MGCSGSEYVKPLGPEGIGASCVDGDEFNAFPGPKKPRNMAAEKEWPKGVKYFDLKWPSQKHFRYLQILSVLSSNKYKLCMSCGPKRSYHIVYVRIYTSVCVCVT